MTQIISDKGAKYRIIWTGELDPVNVNLGQLMLAVPEDSEHASTEEYPVVYSITSPMGNTSGVVVGDLTQYPTQKEFIGYVIEAINKCYLQQLQADKNLEIKDGLASLQ